MGKVTKRERERIETQNVSHLWSVLGEHADELVGVWLATLVQQA